MKTVLISFLEKSYWAYMGSILGMAIVFVFSNRLPGLWQQIDWVYIYWVSLMSGGILSLTMHRKSRLPELKQMHRWRSEGTLSSRVTPPPYE